MANAAETCDGGRRSIARLVRALRILEGKSRHPREGGREEAKGETRRWERMRVGQRRRKKEAVNKKRNM